MQANTLIAEALVCVPGRWSATLTQSRYVRVARHSDAIERHTYWRHEQAPDRTGARDHRIIQCSSLHV